MRILTGLLLLVMSMAAPGTGSAQGTRPSFSVTISVPQEVVAHGSEVKVTIILKNTSNRDIAIPRSPADDQGESHNKLTVRDEEGNLVADKATIPARTDKEKGTQSEVVNLRMETIILFTVKPGDSLKDGIVLSNVYETLSAGKYSLQVERIDDTTKTVVKSNTITLTVTP
jgi:hypothetical protein